MSAADDAYQRAKEIIAKAMAEKKITISFKEEACQALTTIPPEIVELDKLYSVNLSNTQVSDLTPLTSMTSLSSIWLDNTQVSDLTPLSSMTLLNTLMLDSTQVSDLTPLAAFTSMDTLWLQKTMVSDLTPLSGMTKMQTLMLDGAPVTDLTPLAGMILLKTLSLDDTKISDLTPLTAMTKMQMLRLQATRVTDLTPLTAMTQMHTLSFQHTGVADLVPLAGMTEMQALYLSDTKVADLTPLIAMTEMQTLFFYKTDVSDLKPISNMTKLGESGSSGVSFLNTPATRSNRLLQEIGLIKDGTERSVTILAYLSDPTPPPTDKRDVPPMTVDDDGVVRSKDLIPDDIDNDDQEDMRQEVLRKVDNLLGEVGLSNEWAGLSSTATHYRKQVNRPLNNFKLGMLYSAFNTLRLAVEAEESAQAQGRVNDYLPPKIGAALVDLVQTHGLFFMGFKNGADIHAQAMSGLTYDSVSLPLEAREIVASLEGRNTILDVEDQAAMQDDLAAATGEGPSAQIGSIRLRARLWNLMGAIGRASWQGAQWGALVIGASDLSAWVIGNQTAIGKFLIWAQGPGSMWFQQMIQAFKNI